MKELFNQDNNRRKKEVEEKERQKTIFKKHYSPYGLEWTDTLHFL